MRKAGDETPPPLRHFVQILPKFFDRTARNEEGARDMRRSLKAFVIAEAGAARTQAGFAIAALFGVLAMSAFLGMNGGPTAPARSSLPAEEVALMDLLDREIRQFTPGQVRTRLDTYLDPSERTAAQLRNAHRNWAERVTGGRYSDPDLAHDMFAIIDRAMQIRGVRPHPGV